MQICLIPEKRPGLRPEAGIFHIFNQLALLMFYKRNYKLIGRFVKLPVILRNIFGVVKINQETFCKS